MTDAGMYEILASKVLANWRVTAERWRTSG